MTGYVQHIDGVAVDNEDVRRAPYTAKTCQLVVMALKPEEEDGMDVHQRDQYFRVEEGTGEAMLDGVLTAIRAGLAVLVPAGTLHHIPISGCGPLKRYTIHSSHHHQDAVVYPTGAEADKEYFNGKTTA